METFGRLEGCCLDRVFLGAENMHSSSRVLGWIAQEITSGISRAVAAPAWRSGI